MLKRSTDVKLTGRFGHFNHSHVLATNSRAWCHLWVAYTHHYYYLIYSFISPKQHTDNNTNACNWHTHTHTYTHTQRERERERERERNYIQQLKVSNHRGVESYEKNILPWVAVADSKASGGRPLPLLASAFFSISRFSQFKTCIQCKSKKQDTILMSITSRRIDRFSRFFHW